MNWWIWHVWYYTFILWGITDVFSNGMETFHFAVVTVYFITGTQCDLICKRNAVGIILIFTDGLQYKFFKLWMLLKSVFELHFVCMKFEVFVLETYCGCWSRADDICCGASEKILYEAFIISSWYYGCAVWLSFRIFFGASNLVKPFSYELVCQHLLSKITLIK